MGGKNGVEGRAQAARTYRWDGRRLRDSQAVSGRGCAFGWPVAKATMTLKAPLMLLLLTFIRAHLCVPSVHTCFKLIVVIRALVWHLFPVCWCLPSDGQRGQGAVFSVSASEDKGPFFLLLGPAHLRPDPGLRLSHGVGDYPCRFRGITAL